MKKVWSMNKATIMRNIPTMKQVSDSLRMPMPTPDTVDIVATAACADAKESGDNGDHVNEIPNPAKHTIAQERSKFLTILEHPKCLNLAQPIVHGLSRAIPSQINPVRNPRKSLEFSQLMVDLGLCGTSSVTHPKALTNLKPTDVLLWPKSKRSALDDLSIYLGLNSSVYMFEPISNKSFRMWETFRIQKRTQLVIEPILHWSTQIEGQFTPKILPNRLGRRSNLATVHLTLSVANYPPMVMPGANGSWTGISLDILNHIQKVLKFSYSFVPSPDGNWGAQEPDGSWNGFVGQLMNESADICIACITISDERRQVIDFSTPIMWTDQAMFIKNPEEDINHLTYLNPLRPEIWAVLAFICVLGTLAQGLVTRFLKGMEPNHRELGWAKNAIFSVGALTFARRWSVTPVTQSGRLIFISILLGGCFVHFHWKAALVSALTVELVNYPFQSLEGLLASDYKLTFYPNGFSMNNFKQAEAGLFRDIWEKNVNQEFDYTPFTSDTYSETYLSVLTDLNEHVLFDDVLTIRYFQAYQDCRVIQIPQTYLRMPMGFGFQKNSPYLEIFNHEIAKMKENGVFARILEKFDLLPLDCLPKPGRALGMANLASAYSIYILGLTLSVAILILELIFTAWSVIDLDPTRQFVKTFRPGVILFLVIMSFAHQTADYWIEKLGLIPHPGHETGYLNEVYRDTFQVLGSQGDKRSSATNIYFLHKPADKPLDDHSILFRMVNNELLNFYTGHPLHLYMLKEDFTFEKVVLGPNPDEKQHLFQVIPRNTWFVRRLETEDPQAFTLIGCTVSPGYHEDDIETKTLREVKKLGK
eukprot:maker-scaffold41_size498431-snap-gene-3.27 protein:Tk00205 transcript:maker-scaffold41_size498431-snap-gene-3.27-mRNA-1 annotation:"hypothetical protein L798_01404"